MTSAVDSNSPKKPDGCDLVATYLNTADGAYNFHKGIRHIADNALLFPLKPGPKEFATRVSGAFTMAATAMFVPALFAEANDFRHKLEVLKAAKALPTGDPQKQEKVQEAYKKCAVGGIGLFGGTLLDAAFYLESAKLISLGRASDPLNVIYNTAYMITDGTELVENLRSVKENNAKLATTKNEKEKNYLKSLINLSWIKNVRAVSSVGMSAIGLLSVFFLVFVTSPIATAVAAVSLTFSTIYLVANIAAYFFEKTKVDDAKTQLYPTLSKA